MWTKAYNFKTLLSDDIYTMIDYFCIHDHVQSMFICRPFRIKTIKILPFKLAADTKLQQLTHELAQTQQQITMAAEELQRQNEAAAEMTSRHLTEDDKQGMRKTMAKKINKVIAVIRIL